MKKAIFAILVSFLLPSSGWAREGECSVPIYLSAFEINPNFLFLLDNSISMNVILQPTEETGYKCGVCGYPVDRDEKCANCEEYIYDPNIEYEGKFSLGKSIQVKEENQGWWILGEREPNKWICVYLIANDYSGGYGGMYEANYLNWILKKAKIEDSPFVRFGDDEFYRVELCRVNPSYTQRPPTYLRDVTDEEGSPFLEREHSLWYDYYTEAERRDWYRYWYDKPASRMNIAKYVLCDIIRTDLRKIEPDWEYDFRYGLMVFNGYYEWAPIYLEEGPEGCKEADPGSDWVDRGGLLLVKIGTHTVTERGNLDELDSAIKRTVANRFTPLAESLYEACCYFIGTDTFFYTSQFEPGGCPNTTYGLTMTSTYVGMSPIEYWCQDNNILLITDGIPTRDTELPPLKILSKINRHNYAENTIDGWTVSDRSNFEIFDYDGDGAEPPYLQEKEFERSGRIWNENGTGCAQFGEDVDLWCSHYLDDVVYYFGGRDTDIFLNDPYGLNQKINTYIVGFEVDDPFLLWAAEADKYYADGRYNSKNRLDIDPGDDRYFVATSHKKLKEGIIKIIEDIIERLSGSVAVAVSISTSQTEGEDVLVRAKFNPRGWKGYLEAFDVPYCATGTRYWVEGVCKQHEMPIWEAGERLGTETADEDDSSSMRDLNYEAGQKSARKVYTYINGEKVEFSPENLNTLYGTTTLADLLRGTSTLTDDELKALICWIRGEFWVDKDNFNPCDKTEGNAIFIPSEYSDVIKERADGWRLHELVYSTPVIVSAPNAWYGTRTYWEFAIRYREYSCVKISGTEIFEGRERMTYVGDNSGLLHAFKLISDGIYYKDGYPVKKRNAEEEEVRETWQCDDDTICKDCADDNFPWHKITEKCGGWEKWAYIPSNLLPYLRLKAEPGYCPFPMVDLGVGKMDIFMDFDDNGEPEWGTVIIGGEREGGPVWFCLNVTDPNFMTEEGIATKTVLWEYSDVNKLGDSWAFPESGRVKDENDEDRWIVFLTTGANSAGVPYLVALDVTKGEPYKEIHIFYDADNDGVYDAGEIEAEPPLTSVSALDDYKDGVFDDYVDTVYFGDIEGRVWKMTIGSETDDWKPYILFEATDGTGTSQPLSIPPSIAFDQKYRTRLYFGSGKYREKEDVISTQTQTFYCVMDTNLDYSNILYDELPLTREDLDEVEFLDLDRYGNIINNPIPTENVPGCREIGNVVKFIPYGTRTTREKRDIEDDFGWYIDLSYRGCDGQAERSTESPLIYGGYVFFSSVVPTTEKCEAGGYPYLIMLDYLTGLPPEKGVIEEIPEELEGKLASLHISSKEKEEGEERRGGGVPSRPVLGPGGKQLIIQLSAEGELIRINLKRIEPVSILSWGEEGFIECHACE